MRVCPKCGYSENSLWQQDRFAQNLMFMRFEDFKNEFPALAKQLDVGENNIIKGNFMYHLKRNKLYVRRYEIVGGSMSTHFEGVDGSWTSRKLGRLARKVASRRHPDQTKLLEITQEE